MGTRRTGARWAAIVAAVVAVVLTLAPNLAFPEPGRFPFVWSSYISIPIWCAGALFLTWRARGRDGCGAWSSATASPRR